MDFNVNDKDDIDFNTQSVISFYCGNPIVELTRGEIHLFQPASQTTNLKKSKIVATLAVPSYMSISEFCLFTGAFAVSMKHVRVLRTHSLNKYLLIIKFDEQKDADAFFNEFNQKLFSSMTTESCCVAYVNKVIFLQPKNSLLFPPSGQAEVPTCSICLEKLDPSTSGLLTILCNHSFHSNCLSQWRDENRCPICRYTQTPFGEKSVCISCGLDENLWLCLICGFIGCSRYKGKHAQEHFESTKHTYALELESQKVWDYTKEAFLHRLVSSNSGKVVEIANPNSIEQTGNTVKQTDLLMDSEEASALEWQMLLSAQIETQKKFYEERIADIEQKSILKICVLEKELQELINEKNATTHKIDVISNERRLLENKTSILQKRVRGVVQETQFLKTMNLALAKNKDSWLQKLKETEELSHIAGPKDLKIQELELQVQELMKTLEEEATEEVQIYNNISLKDETNNNANNNNSNTEKK